MTTIAGKPKQLQPDNNPYLVRTPFVHPNDYKPGMDAARWRLIAAEPVNKMARRMVQREVGSLNWIIRPTDNESEQQRAAVTYYSVLFADFRHLASRVLKGVCELPQGGAWEVGWIPAKFGEARGTPAFIDFLDAGTLHPTTSKQLPIVMIDPTNSLRRKHFKDHQIVRILANPRDEFDREWWQESPTEASFLQIEALARLYTFSLKQLLDTPPIGILDLMDFSADSAKKWADSFREIIEGIDPIKIPVLYEHEKAAQYISLANDFERLKVDEQFKRYAELVLGNYGLSIEDLRIFDHAGSKAGMAVSQKTTVRSGISFFAELIKDAVQSVLPDFLTFEYSEPDVDEERSKAQIRAADARTLQTMPWLPIRVRVELAKRWNLLGDLDVDPEEIEKEAKEEAEKMMQQAGSQSPPGAGGTDVPRPRPGQLERGEGRNPDLLEDESKRQAARGPRIFARAETLIDDAGERIKAFYPKGDQRYGKKTHKAADKFEKLLAEQFQRIGAQVTVGIVQQLLDIVYTQFPEVLQQLPNESPTVKAWVNMVERFLDEDYVEKQDERQAGIEALIEQALEEATFYSLSEQQFLVRLMEILTLAFEDGLLGISEGIQAHLFAQGKVKSPGVNISYRVTDPAVIRMLGNTAAQLVQNVDNGTKYYLRRMITEGALQGLSADELTDRIVGDLFILPEKEAAKLPASRIRSIVNTELNRADSLGRLAEMKALGLKTKRWVTRKVDVCVVCIRNEALGVMPMEHMYESVFRLQDFLTPAPPAHPRTCHCHIAMVGEELDRLAGTINYWTGGTDRPEKAEFEKYDPNPEREPEGTDKRDSTGGRAGGQFAPKGGAKKQKVSTGVKKHMSPSGIAIAEGRTTADTLTQREFVGLFDPSEYGTGTTENPNVPVVDSWHVFKEFGEGSLQHEEAKRLDSRVSAIRKELNMQFREALRKHFSDDLNETTIAGQRIGPTNAANVWKLLRGDVGEIPVEKYDPNPSRWEAGTSHTDSLGHGAGGQFKPKNGGKSTKTNGKTVVSSRKKPTPKKPAAKKPTLEPKAGETASEFGKRGGDTVEAGMETAFQRRMRILEESRDNLVARVERLKETDVAPKTLELWEGRLRELEADIERGYRQERTERSREMQAALEQSAFKETNARTYLRERAKTEFVNMLTPFTEKELAASDKQIYEHDGVFYMIDNGDLQGVVNVSGRRGVGQEAIIDGIVRGGKTLDAFGGFLDNYYARFGFVETDRLKFDPEYAPDNWDYDRFDNPDVVFMEYPEGLSRDPEEIRKRFESAGERAKSEVGRSDRSNDSRRRELLSKFAERFDRLTRRKVGPKVPGLRAGAGGLHAESDVEKFDPSPQRDVLGRFTFKPQTKRRGKNTAGDLYYMVRFRETRAIDRLADYAKEFVDGDGVKWEPQENYHTTLVFLPDMPEHMIDPLTAALHDLPSIPLSTDRFGTFSTARDDPSNVLFLRVRRTPELEALFNLVHEQAVAAGVKISEYSDPATWKPHITLAYADEPFDESKLPEIGGVGLGSLQIDAIVDRSLVNQSPPKEDTFEPVAEKYDPDPNREPAGTTKTDSTGERAGGQFAPKNGESAGGRSARKRGGSAGAKVVPRRGNNPPGRTLLERLAGQRRKKARELREANEASENGPDNEVYVPHTPTDTELKIDIETSLDYEAKLFFRIPEQWTEAEMEAVRYYYDALHASTLAKTQQGNKLPQAAEEALRRVELELIGLDYERGYSIRPNGSTALKLEGERTSIQLDPIEMSLLNRSYFTHSHPVDRPLSPRDMAVAIKHNIPEIRAVTPTATYRWSFNDTSPDLLDWENATNAEYQFMDWTVDAIGEVDDATAAEMVKLQHAGLIRLAEQFGATYTRELHDA